MENKCPFHPEFGKWIECPHLGDDGVCIDNEIADNNPIGHGGSWCTTMVSRAMLAHKIWIGNDY
jgi:hypothetical protein